MELHDRTINGILEAGYVIQWMAHSPMHPHSRAYTVGRTLYEQPEILVSGLNAVDSQEILDHLVELQTEGKPFGEGSEITVGEYYLRFIKAEPGVLPGAIASFATSVTAIQAVWETDDSPGDHAQTLYPRGFLTANDPYGEP